MNIGYPEPRKFQVGDRVKRASDGKAGVITATTQLRKGVPMQVQVKWDNSGSKSTRETDGLVHE